MKKSRILSKLPPKLGDFLGIAFITAVFCHLFILAHKSIVDLDIWLHLKAGEVIWRSGGIVPTKDIFSFTMPAKSWIDHEWLFQVIAYLIHNRWGADGLIFLEVIVIILSFFILALAALKSANSYLVTGALIFITANAASSRFNIRPDIFSLLFFVSCLYLLRYQINTRKIWFIIPLEIIWVNIHGYFFLGPLVVFMFIFSEFLRRSITFLPLGQKKEFVLKDVEYIRLKKVLFFSIAACFLNPYVVRGALYPLFVLKEMLLGRAQVFFKYIQELRPVFTFSIGSSAGDFYPALILTCFVLMVVNFRRLKVIEELLFIFFFLFALTLRNVAFFSVICFMIIISYLPPMLSRLANDAILRGNFARPVFRLIRYVLCAVLIVWLAQRVNTDMSVIYYDFSGNKIKDTVSGIDQRRYPEKAVNFVLENKLPVRMFNNFNAGAYLINRGYPERKVFIDGRTEFYGPDFFKEQQKMVEGDQSAFKRIADKYNLEAFLLSYARSNPPEIIRHIYNDPQWSLVFLDEAAVIFLKNNPANAALIKKYRIDLNKYSVVPADLIGMGIIRTYPAPYISRSSLFSLLGKDDLAISEAKEALRVLPDCPRAYQLLGKIYLRRGEYLKALENFRAAILLLPQDPETLVDLAQCLVALKEESFAIRALRGALRFNRRYAPIYNQLGVIYLAQKNYEEAIKFLRKAVRYAPDDAASHLSLGKALYNKGIRREDGSYYIAKANDEFKKASELNLRTR